MATRKPLIVNPTVSQIQELPTGDSLDGIVDLTATGTITANEFVGSFTHSPSQPNCLLTVPVEYTIKNTEDPSNHKGGDNQKPISFTNVTTNVGCTTSLSGTATSTTTGITSITVPSAGTYLVSACISGNKVSGSGTDQIRFGLAKSGIGTFPSTLTYPTFIFGDDNQAEFNCTFTLPLPLSANDTLSVHLSHIGASKAKLQDGYFSVTKLH